jgi:hypothetical protein
MKMGGGRRFYNLWTSNPESYENKFTILFLARGRKGEEIYQYHLLGMGSSLP